MLEEKSFIVDLREESRLNMARRMNQAMRGKRGSESKRIEGKEAKNEPVKRACSQND